MTGINEPKVYLRDVFLMKFCELSLKLANKFTCDHELTTNLFALVRTCKRTLKMKSDLGVMATLSSLVTHEREFREKNYKCTEDRDDLCFFHNFIYY